MEHFLFDNPKTEYLLIDEVDKINKKDQTVLYNVMGSERLQHAFRSRFMEFYLSEYSLGEFSLYSRYKLRQSIVNNLALVYTPLNTVRL
jgi:hypothetical protein